MPFIETTEDIAEELADAFGVYGCHDEDEKKPCRICFIETWQHRIKASVANEKQIEQGKEDKGG